MKKTILFLVVLSSLIFVLPGQANAPISILVNGAVLQTDVPPMIIDGRTMVPLSTIARSLNCSVEWNADKRQVYIASKEAGVADKTEITGPENFRIFISECLDAMDSENRQFVISHLHRIVFDDPPRFPNSYAYSDINSTGTCYINGNFFGENQTALSRSENLYGYIGYLVHEANHFNLRDSGAFNLYTSPDREALCDIAALKAIARAGGGSSVYYGQFKNSLQAELKY